MQLSFCEDKRKAKEVQISLSVLQLPLGDAGGSAESARWLNCLITPDTGHPHGLKLQNVEKWFRNDAFFFWLVQDKPEQTIFRGVSGANVTKEDFKVFGDQGEIEYSIQEVGVQLS